MGKKRKKNQHIRYVEIKTNRNNWIRVQFIKFKSNGKALFRLASGEYITRTATKKIHWGVTSKYHKKDQK